MEKIVSGSLKTRCKCKGKQGCPNCEGTGWRPRSDPYRPRRPKRFKNNKLPPEQRERDHGLWVKYGITLLEFNQMLESQGNKCACCGTTTPDTRGWFVDHIHEPGEGLTQNRTFSKHGRANIRGVVCGRCNAAAGLVEAVGVETVLRFIGYSCSQCKNGNNSPSEGVK